MNILIIANNDVIGTVAGGRSVSGTTKLNQATINGGIPSLAIGGYNLNNDTYENTLTINGGAVAFGAYGGFIYPTGTGNAYNNFVNINA